MLSIKTKTEESKSILQTAEEEYYAKWRSLLTYRKPTPTLPTRLLTLLTSPSFLSPNHPYTQYPTLHYGFFVTRKQLDALIAKNQIDMTDPQNPEFSEDFYEIYAPGVIESLLTLKCRVEIDLVKVLVDPDVHWKIGEGYVVAVDNTRELRQVREREWWESKGKCLLDMVREEFELGDEEAKWFWDARCGPRYVCPLLEYNTPEVSAMVREELEEMGEDSGEESYSLSFCTVL